MFSGSAASSARSVLFAAAAAQNSPSYDARHGQRPGATGCSGVSQKCQWLRNRAAGSRTMLTTRPPLAGTNAAVSAGAFVTCATHISYGGDSSGASACGARACHACSG